MKKCKLKNVRNGEVIAESVEMAENFFTRLVGLMFRKKIESNEGMLISRCNSIHTCFMNFPIDVVFLNRNKKVVKIINNVSPWRMTSLFLRAEYALELKGNSLNNSTLEIGDEIEVICLN